MAAGGPSPVCAASGEAECAVRKRWQRRRSVRYVLPVVSKMAWRTFILSPGVLWGAKIPLRIARRRFVDVSERQWLSVKGDIPR